MLAIVFLHSVSAFGVVSPKSDLAVVLVTPFKFGTIGFFLISGFLLGERVDRRNPREYFMRRFNRLFFPWAFWFFTACALLVIAGMGRLGPAMESWRAVVELTAAAAGTMLVDSSLWFVPNLLLCIAILLIFRRFLYHPGLGLGLLAANLVYAVNIYTLWFSPKHSEALFGFVFYLWLGSYAAHHFERVSRWLQKTRTAVFVAAALISMCAAFAETRLLQSLGSPEPSSTLRVTNQIFSVCVVLVIAKIGRATWPRFLDVRRHTFGLYLAHPVALMFAMHAVAQIHLAASRLVAVADLEGIAAWLSAAVAVYSACLATTIWLADRPALAWMVGVTAPADEMRKVERISEPEALLQSA